MGKCTFGNRVYKAGFKQGFFDDAPASHGSRGFRQQFRKKIRQIKGHYDGYLLIGDKTTSVQSFASVCNSVLQKF